MVATEEALSKAGRPEIVAIGFSGQMHGAVLLDRDNRLLGPAIIWADQRSADLLLEIKERMGGTRLARQCGTAPTVGFLIASVYWLQKFEPETLDRTTTVLLPKDYLRFRLTSELGTDETDAASSGIFNVNKRGWADEVIERLGFPKFIFPKVSCFGGSRRHANR